jgi:transcriptional regulator with XRE-family HTH domain
MSPRTPLGRLLQARREALGYSRTRAGAILGIPAGTIEGWELGRVAKPPLHDVLKLARLLGISAVEIEAAALGAREATSGREPVPAGGAVPLLEQAIEVFGWTEAQAAAALRTTGATVRAWRSGKATMTLPDVMAVAALLGLHAAGVAAPQTPTVAPRAPAG